ncbi:MAG: ABC transporter ATP-binding protein [Bdellovibrionales bacterium]|nr:ABC transporter ATP-binding protein [Bdellovibrionales bacterium]
MGKNTLLKLEKLTKIYRSGDRQLEVLREVDLTLEAGESCSLIGPSGSGKTTLLGLCAGLDRPSSGAIELLGVDLVALTEDQLAELRNRSVGFVFQSFQLIPTLTALENVMVPAELAGERGAKERARELLARVGLGDREDHYPTQLSGGEQQRVAIARAYLNTPKILFADEPTGNLDEATAASIQDLLFELNRSQGTALLIATHNLELAKLTTRAVRMEGGKVVEQQFRP